MRTNLINSVSMILKLPLLILSLFVASISIAQDAEPPELPEFDRDAIEQQQREQIDQGSRLAAEVTAAQLAALVDQNVYAAYAKALQTYYQELKEAGFSDEQAWQIVLHYSISFDKLPP